LVGDADDPVDSLAVEDPFAFGDGVASQLGPLANEGCVAPAGNVEVGILREWGVLLAVVCPGG